MTETQGNQCNEVLLSGNRKKMTVISPNGRRAVLRSPKPFSDKRVEEAQSDKLFVNDIRGDSYTSRFEVLGHSVMVHLHRNISRLMLFPHGNVDLKGNPPPKSVMVGWGRTVIGIGWCLAIGLGLTPAVMGGTPVASAQPAAETPVNPCGPDAHPVEMVIGCAPTVTEYDDWRDLITRGMPRG